MKDYIPISGVWFLARPKVPYYGAYPAGVLGRARDLLGVGPHDYVLHACSGMVRDYPYRGLGSNDYTMDLDPLLFPDFCQDVRDPWPLPSPNPGARWDAILSDPPYSPEDADHYACGRDPYPNPKDILKRAWEVLRPGGKVGIFHYVIPTPPKDAIFTACIGIVMGFGNKGRFLSVFEKPWK